MGNEPEKRTNWEQICVAFPTIMSGLVLRWYSNTIEQTEIANAGRESATFKFPVSAELRTEVQAAHEHIKAAHYRNERDIDVSRWVTHRRVRFMSDELEPVAVGAVGETGQP